MSVFSKKHENEPLDLSGLAAAAPVVEPAAEPKKIPIPAALLTPEAQAATNQMVSEAVKSIFAQLAPVLQSIAMTPEKIAQAEAIRRMPTEKEVAQKLREEREKKLTQQEAEENRQNLLRTQAACPHRYPTGQWSLGIIRNYPDRQPRGVCMLCQAFFEPKRWVIGPPDAENPRGRAYIAPEHPQYHLVLEVLATKS